MTLAYVLVLVSKLEDCGFDHVIESRSILYSNRTVNVIEAVPL